MLNKKITSVVLMVASCLLLTACPSYTATLLNLVLSGTINGIKLAASIEGKAADPVVLQRITDEGNALIIAYNDWVAADINSKPTLWPKVSAALTIVQNDFPAVLKGFGITDPAYQAVADFVISEIQSLGSVITGQPTQLANHKKLASPTTKPEDFKKNYNQKMVAAGHPELQIK